MKRRSTKYEERSSIGYGDLEGMIRQKARDWIQDILEEEVTAILGRARHERQQGGIDAVTGYRNGYGKPRKVALMSGTVEVRRPRIRDLDERFESRVLPLFKRRSREIGQLLPDLYLHGLSTGDFELALRGLLGEGAPLSASSIGRLKGKWKVEYDEWRRCDLSNGDKVLLACESGQRESKESWLRVLRDLRARGLQFPRLTVADGHLGIWAALGELHPDGNEQRCWNHKSVNVLDALPKKEQEAAKELLRQMAYADSREECEKVRDRFRLRYQKSDSKAVETLMRDWDRMVTFYSYPKEHWKHLRTTNIVESPFATIRLRTNAARRFKRVDNATAMIWKLMTVAEKRWRKLDAPERLKDVAEGKLFKDGIEMKTEQSRVAA
jgi:putative transposase